MYRELSPWHRRGIGPLLLLLSTLGFLFLVSLPVASLNGKHVPPFESHFPFRIPMLSSDLYPAQAKHPWFRLLLCYGIAYFSLESDQTMLSSAGTTVPKTKS